MTKRVLNKPIFFQEDISSLIKSCIRNHIIAYNYALKYLTTTKDIVNIKTLRKEVMEYVKRAKLYPIIRLSLYVELYYLIKKFNKGIKRQKNISDIQYLTFLISNIDKCFIRINLDDKTCTSIRFNELLTQEEIENIRENISFINLSYSNINDSYMLSAFS